MKTATSRPVKARTGKTTPGRQKKPMPADPPTGRPLKLRFLGRPSLTAQLKAASGQNGFMAEGLALLESLLKAAGIDDTDKAA